MSYSHVYHTDYSKPVLHRNLVLQVNTISVVYHFFSFLALLG